MAPPPDDSGSGEASRSAGGPRLDAARLRRLALTFALGAVGVGAIAALPIEPAAVQEKTAARLLRDAIPAVLPEGDGALTVALEVEAGPAFAPAVTAAVNRITHLKTAVHPVGGQPLPTLRVAVERVDEQVQVKTRYAASGDTPKEETAASRVGDWRSLLPPLLALVIALGLQRVILAMFCGVWAGATVVAGGNPVAGFAGAFTNNIGPVFGSSFELYILGFTLALVGMVSVIGRMGGTRGLVEALSGVARGPRSAQGLAQAMGLVVFFDDYANTVVVGSTARSLTDRLRVSREKLAYIVDSTSAPVAGVAFISTWIGYEVGLFEGILSDLGAIPNMPGSGYALFFDALPLRFYCFFALLMVLIVAVTGRDFGPMLKAERRVRAGGPPSPDPDAAEPEALEKPGVPHRWFNAVIPIVSLVALIVGGIWANGDNGGHPAWVFAGWKSAFDTADPAYVLFWATLAASLLTFLLAVGQRLLSPVEILRAYGGGMVHILPAAAVLVLAWAIKSVCDELGTGLALVTLVGDTLSPIALPLAIFLVSAAIAFSTGTSWGAMALVLPVAAPLAAALTQEPVIVFATLAAVLDGAIWGDHCSPISDTTVLSSTATGCPLVDHVRTQVPYAVVAMIVAAVCGYLAHAAGVPLAVCYGGGAVVLFAVVRGVGRDPGADGTAPV
ncbi:MAG: Na+/H+ antiporter NhaC family protein [Planctomycetota bacterium]|jgi:Na+/H+ antiporter NhaC